MYLDLKVKSIDLKPLEFAHVFDEGTR